MTLDAPPASAPLPGWRIAEALAVPAGWAVAVAAALLPSAQPGAGRGAALLVLGLVLPWWVAVLWVVRSDLLEFIIPDEASLLIAGLGLAAAAGAPWLAGDGAAVWPSTASAVAVGAGGFAVFWLVGAACRSFGRDALGFGDVKLAGACAVWLSPADAAMALELAALGAIAALVLGRGDGRLRDTAVPFGAFMAPAAWLVFVLAPPLREAGLLAP